MIFKIGDYIDGTIINIEDDCAFALVANIFKCYIPIEEMTYNTMGHTAFEFVSLNENTEQSADLSSTQILMFAQEF